MNDSLGDRMKRNYEQPARHYLTRRMPVVIRLDGRAFHTVTSKSKKPFDPGFIDTMVAAAESVFDEIQGCKMAYVQSDEASFVLTDYDSLTTEAWFGYNKSKIESIAASIMSVYFNMFATIELQAPPVFDARAFNVPEEEVSNYFLWRAKDWHRNSVQMLAQHHFSHDHLQGLNTPTLLSKLDDCGYPWDQLDERLKNGTFLYWGEGPTNQRTDVRDRYVEIDELWESVNPTTMSQKPLSRNQRRKKGAGSVLKIPTRAARAGLEPARAVTPASLISERKSKLSEATQTKLSKSKDSRLDGMYEWAGCPCRLVSVKDDPVQSTCVIAIIGRNGNEQIVSHVFFDELEEVPFPEPEVERAR
jgi:tRNA(His) guanylyltransferase